MASQSQISHDLKRYLNIRSVSSPKFSNDGKNIVFLANITGVSQVWMANIDGCALELLSVDDEERVTVVDYSKTKDLIAYSIDHGGDERYQINVIENKGEKMSRITNNLKVIHEFGSFSPDGKRVSYSSNLRNQFFFDVYVQEIDSETNSGELVYQSDDTNANSKWSPSGDKLLFTTIHAPFNHELFLLDLKSRNVESVYPHKDDAIFDFATFSKDGEYVYCITNCEREFSSIARISLKDQKLEYIHSEDDSEIEILKQSPDKSILAFAVNKDGYSELKTCLLSGENVRKLDLPSETVISDLDWSPDSKNLAVTLSSSTLNTDVWTISVNNSEMRRVTRVSSSGIPENSFSPEKLHKYKSFDGLEITSYLFLPKEKGKDACPLLVYLHGGPESQFRPTFNPLLQYFLHLGIAVGVPNFRGSTG
jgi:dipeptidyl aminopeptidase/acylaminoacyl peptidase